MATPTPLQVGTERALTHQMAILRHVTGTVDTVLIAIRESVTLEIADSSFFLIVTSTDYGLTGND